MARFKKLKLVFPDEQDNKPRLIFSKIVTKVRDKTNVQNTDMHSVNDTTTNVLKSLTSSVRNCRTNNVKKIMKHYRPLAPIYPK